MGKYLYLHLVTDVLYKSKCNLEKGSILSCPHSKTEITTINYKTGEISRLCTLEFLKRIPTTNVISKKLGIELRDIAIAKGHANTKDWAKWIGTLKDV